MEVVKATAMSLGSMFAANIENNLGSIDSYMDKTESGVKTIAQDVQTIREDVRAMRQDIRRMMVAALIGAVVMCLKGRGRD